MGVWHGHVGMCTARAHAQVLACTEGTLLVELTIDSPYTRHYEHAAAALGLQYAGEPLDPDPRGVGAAVVTLGERGRARVDEAVAARLRQHAASVGGPRPASQQLLLHDEP